MRPEITPEQREYVRRLYAGAQRISPSDADFAVWYAKGYKAALEDVFGCEPFQDLKK